MMTEKAFKCLQPENDLRAKFITDGHSLERYCLEAWVCNECIRRDSELSNETQTNCGFTMKSGKGCGVCDGCIEEMREQDKVAPKVASKVEIWAILATSFGFQLGKIIEKSAQIVKVEIVGDSVMQPTTFDRLCIVAEGTDYPTLEHNILKAKEREKQLRPMWQATIEHEKRVRGMMLDAVYAVARGE